MADWADLAPGFADVDPPLHLLRRIEQRERELRGGRPAPARPRRLVPWIAGAAAGLAVVGLLAVAAHSRSQRPAGHPPPTPHSAAVPDVRGMPVLRAARTLQRVGFAVAIPRPFVLSSQSPEPRVSDESPGAGSQAVAGEVVKLSLKNTCCLETPGVGGTLIMPDVTGDRLDVALRLVHRSAHYYHVIVPPIEATRSPILSAFTVTGQSPKPGTDVGHQPGNEFRLPTLEVGVRSTAEPTVTVPDVSGLPLAKAIRILQRHGLDWRPTAQTRRFRHASGVFVLQQAPRLGSSVPAHSTIALFLSVRVASGALCDASQLQLSSGPELSPGTGQNPRAFRVTNTGPSCMLRGYPSIELRDGSDTRIPFEMRNHGDQMVTDRSPPGVSMPTGAAAWFQINNYRCDAGGVAAARMLVLSTGTGSATGVSLPRRQWVAYCGVGDPGSILFISPFEPTLAATMRH